MLAVARMLRPSLPHLRFAYGLPSAYQAYGLQERKNTAHPTKKARFLLTAIMCIMTG